MEKNSANLFLFLALVMETIYDLEISEFTLSVLRLKTTLCNMKLFPEVIGEIHSHVKYAKKEINTK